MAKVDLEKSFRYLRCELQMLVMSQMDNAP